MPQSPIESLSQELKASHIRPVAKTKTAKVNKLPRKNGNTSK
jgi:hypothetical protein